MPSRNLIIAAGAVIIGLFAVLLVNGVFSGVEKRQEEIAEANRMVRLAVASQELAFGTQLSNQNVRLVNWPAASVPEGAFTSLEEATKARVALRPIVVGEPILASKVSGANGRATLSANLPAGQLAYAVPISEITAAGGFIRPGDVVDVLVTRRIPGESLSDSDKMTDVVLEAVPVLAVAQESSESKTDPSIAKSATLQVDTLGAQKLALAQQLGVLTLALRNVADTSTNARGTVLARDITTGHLAMADRPPPTVARASAPAPRVARRSISAPTYQRSTMTIVRGTKATQEGTGNGN